MKLLKRGGSLKKSLVKDKKKLDELIEKHLDKDDSEELLEEIKVSGTKSQDSSLKQERKGDKDD